MVILTFFKGGEDFSIADHLYDRFNDEKNMLLRNLIRNDEGKLGYRIYDWKADIHHKVRIKYDVNLTT